MPLSFSFFLHFWPSHLAQGFSLVPVAHHLEIDLCLLLHRFHLIESLTFSSEICPSRSSLELCLARQEWRGSPTGPRARRPARASASPPPHGFTSSTVLMNPTHTLNQSPQSSLIPGSIAVDKFHSLTSWYQKTMASLSALRHLLPLQLRQQM